MKTIYCIRHGSTELNQEDRARGWSNVPLSDKGIEEARKTALKLKNSGIQAIVCSDLKRAVQTAREIRETTGASLEGSEKLRPWNVGTYTGKDSKLIHPKLRKYAIDMPDRQIPEGESFNQFKNRFFDGLLGAIEKYRDKKLAIVTHRSGERLIKAWKADGQQADRHIDFAVFFDEKGTPPANSEIMNVNDERLKKNPKSRTLNRMK